MKKEIYGMGRSRDRKGKVIDYHLNPYVMCMHTMMDCGYENMQVLVAEIIRYEQKAF
ncbi:MAG: hypothetical protein ACI4TK_17365 [Agathobacter sp.]